MVNYDLGKINNGDKLKYIQKNQNISKKIKIITFTENRSGPPPNTF